jgi:hypothetical protein
VTSTSPHVFSRTHASRCFSAAPCNSEESLTGTPHPSSQSLLTRNADVSG